MKRPLAVFSDKSVLLEKRLHVPRSILDSSNVGYNDVLSLVKSYLSICQEVSQSRASMIYEVGKPYRHGLVPTKGLIATQRFALGAIFVYQLALGYRFEHGLDWCIGLKAFLKAA